MINLLIHLRSANLAAHHFHNIAARAVFMQDHEFFGEAYGAYEDAYDSVAERLIGLQGDASFNIYEVAAKAAMKLKAAPGPESRENSVFYSYLDQAEQELRALINQEIQKGVSEGTRQMLGDLCDKSEVRSYKISRRLKK